MTEHHVKIRIHVRQAGEESNSATPSHEGSRPTRSLRDIRPFRKGTKHLLFTLSSILAVGLVIAYVSLPTNDLTSSRPGMSEIDLAATDEKRSGQNDAGLSEAQEETSPSVGTLSASGEPVESLSDLTLDTAAGLPSPGPGTITGDAAREESAEAPPAPAGVRHDHDVKLAETVQDTTRAASPTPTMGQDSPGKVQANLSSLRPLKALPSTDKRVARSHLTSGMRGREPVDRLGSSVTLAGRKGRTVFYFTDLRGLAGQTIVHRWERNGTVVANIPFAIDGKRWRVYSSNTLTVSEKGNWRVVVADANGAVLASQSFVVAQR